MRYTTSNMYEIQKTKLALSLWTSLVISLPVQNQRNSRPLAK